jgi:hypothetical protein
MICPQTSCYRYKKTIHSDQAAANRELVLYLRLVNLDRAELHVRVKVE